MKALRKSKKLTLDGLSELTGISPSYLSRLEAGERQLNEDLIDLLTAALECDVPDLLNSASKDKPLFEKKRNDISEEQNLPIYELLTTFEGDHVINLHQARAQTWRIPHLGQSPKAYAMGLHCKKYAPKYNPGDVLFINPESPLTSGCVVILIESDKKFHIGHYVSEVKNLIHIKYIQSEKDHFFMRENDVECHRIVGNFEL